MPKAQGAEMGAGAPRRFCLSGMSLRLRIMFGFAVLMVASLYFVMHLVMKDVRPRYLESVEEGMVDTAEFAASVLSAQATGGTLHFDNVSAAMQRLEARKFSAKIFDAVKTTVVLRIYVTDAQGILLYDSSGENAPGTDFSLWRDVRLTLRGQYGARSTRKNKDDPTSSVLYIAAPIFAPLDENAGPEAAEEQKIIGVVTVGKPQDSVTFFIDIAHKRLFLMLLFVGLGSISLAALFSFWITRPIKKLTGYVRSVQGGESPRMPPLGSSEMGMLGDAIDDMQRRLAGKNYIEDYVRALTHEMKSPLTGIRGAAEILRDHVDDAPGVKFLDNIEAEAARMQSLVERMLQLSRLENAKHINKSRIDAATLYSGIADSFQARLAERGLMLAVAVPEGLSFAGDALLMRQALDNLVGNACDFSPRGGRIVLQAEKREGAVLLSVQDEGTGIPEFALPKAFDKFFSLGRPGTGKKSSGLGLAFVKEVALQHEGEVTLRNTEPGLCVEILLPSE